MGRFRRRQRRKEQRHHEREQERLLRTMPKNASWIDQLPFDPVKWLYRVPLWVYVGVGLVFLLLVVGGS